jgi:hypothetical protein
MDQDPATVLGPFAIAGARAKLGFQNPPPAGHIAGEAVTAAVSVPFNSYGVQ